MNYRLLALVMLVPAFVVLAPALLLGAESPSSTTEPTAPDAAPATSTNETILITAAALPKYRVETNDAGMLIDMPPEEMPFVVDSLTEDFIRERNPTDLDQLISYQPGIYQGGKTVMARHAGMYTIRGYGGCEVRLGGVPLTGGIGSFLDPVMLERVDIVKGPVGGAYGGQASAMDSLGGGGSILLRPKRPIVGESFTDLEFRASNGIGSGQRVKLSIDSNQQLGTNVYARLPASIDVRSPDWTHGDAHPGSNYTIAPSLLWLADDRLSIGFDVLAQYSDQPAYQGIRTSYGKPVDGDWDSTTARASDRMKFSTYGITAYAEGRLSDTWRLRSTASYYQTQNRYNYRGPGSSIRLGYEYAVGDRIQRNIYLSQEAIAEFETAAIEHQFLVGIDYLLKDASGRSSFSTIETPLSALASTSSRQNKSGFTAQDLMTWGDLRLLAGVRVDRHSSTEHVHRWSPSPRLGLSYSILPELIAFANVAWTRTPNFNYEKANGVYLTGDWEALQSEAGLRANPIDSVWLTASAFHIRQSGTPVLLAGSTYYTEEGKTQSQGVELSASGNLTDRWSLYLAYTYIDYYDRTAHQRFDRFPPHAATLWTSYKAAWLGDTVLGAGIRYRDDWFMTFRGAPQGARYRADSLLTFDLSAEYPLNDTISIYCALRNLFNSRGIESARNLQAFANEGRTFELAIRIRF